MLNNKSRSIIKIVFQNKLDQVYHQSDICLDIFFNDDCFLYTDRKTDRYFIDRKRVITDLFVIEMKEIYVHVYTSLLIC